MVSRISIYDASGEAGAFQPGEDRHGKGRSGPPGSECCVVVGDGDREAYAAIRWGVRLSLEIDKVAEAEPVISVEGNMCGTVMRGAVAPSAYGPQTIAEIYASSSNRLLLQRYAGNAAAVVTA